MRERLHTLAGEMHIYSKPLHGTRIEVSLPLNRGVEVKANGSMDRHLRRSLQTC